MSWSITLDIVSIGKKLTKCCHFKLDVQSDDGGGMDPEAMRRCLSFGFSDKKSKSAIGQCKDPMGLFCFIVCLTLSMT